MFRDKIPAEADRKAVKGKFDLEIVSHCWGYIPGGTQPGTVLKITGKGLPNRQGNPGNILVKIIGQTPSGLSESDKRIIEQIGKKYS